MSPIEFASRRYATWGPRLGLDGTCWSASRPDDFPARSGRVVEEVLETFVSLHLPELTGLPLTLVGRSSALVSDQDITATDPLGRVHLFELKKDSVGKKDFQQSTQYALQHVFQSSSAFLESRWKGRAEWLAHDLPVALAGMYANVVAQKFPIKGIRRHLASNPRLPPEQRRDLSNYAWRKLSRTERAGLSAQVLLAMATSEGEAREADELTAAFLASVATQWAQRLGRSALPPRPRGTMDRPLVVWLVAPRVSPSALEEARRWRAMGVDVRAIQLDLRKHPGEARWSVRCEREAAPHLLDLESRVFESLEGDPAESAPLAKVRLELYEPVSPSKPLGETGGRPLSQPRAVVKRWRRDRVELQHGDGVRS